MGRNWRGTSCMCGPFTTSQMRQLFQRGEINGKTQARYGTNTPWKSLEDVPMFAEINAEEESKQKQLQFLRKYGVAIALVVVIICVIVYKQECPSGYKNYPSREILGKDAIVDLTNKARALDHLPPLKENTLLVAIAESRADDMFKKQYFAHVSPDGQGASDVAQKVGYRYKILSENIGSGLFSTNQRVIDNWMQSPGHRKNILSPKIEDIGVAVVKGKMDGLETYIAVQIFGLQSPPVPQQTCIAPPQSLLAQIELKKNEITNLNDQIARLRRELDVEKDFIEAERGTRVGSEKGHNLEVKVNAYNEKSQWHNKVLAEVKAKSPILQSMVDEYNRALENYRHCSVSD
ncbi:MAG TPA: CAP domain-containing protein [Syntrophorhabdaceae bacterium]|jgi:hypothetical protein